MSKLSRSKDDDLFISQHVPSFWGKGRVLVLTHAEGGDRYSTLAGKAVSTKAALTFQQDLFVTPAEDGLFPGHSQTWRKEG